MGGRGQLFVHLKTDEGVEGLGVGMSAPGVDRIVENGFADLLVGQDPLDTERLWRDLFWRGRQFGGSGIAAYALSAVDIALWDLKAKALGLPLFKLLGAYTDTVPMYGSGGWVNLSRRRPAGRHRRLPRPGHPPRQDQGGAGNAAPTSART